MVERRGAKAALKIRDEASIRKIFQESFAHAREASTVIKEHGNLACELDYGEPITLDAFPLTRSRNLADMSLQMI